MKYFIPAFKAVGIIFAISALITGVQAIVDPVGFSKVFGLPLDSTQTAMRPYVSLMGVRQLATGIILLTFAFQKKWTEMATILAIIGIVVAGTDGIFLSRGGAAGLGLVHAIPGAGIAALASGFIYLSKASKQREM